MIKRLKSLKNGLKIDFDLRQVILIQQKTPFLRLFKIIFYKITSFLHQLFFPESVNQFRKRQTAHLLQDCTITLKKESIGIGLHPRIKRHG